MLYILESRHYNKFICELCPSSKPQYIRDARNHRNKAHLKCRKAGCGKLFWTTEARDSHSKNCFQRCPECQLPCNKSFLKNHKKICHKAPVDEYLEVFSGSSIVCRYCNRKFRNAGEAMRHLRGHWLKKYKCTRGRCKAHFATNEKRIEHERSHETHFGVPEIENEFACGTGNCSSTFNQARTLHQHRVDCGHYPTIYPLSKVGYDDSAPGCQIVQRALDDDAQPPVLSKSRSCRACDAMANPRLQERKSCLRNTSATLEVVCMNARSARWASRIE